MTKSTLNVLNVEKQITHLKVKVDPETLTWRNPRRDDFWTRIPLWKDVTYEEFLSHKWQEKNAITNADKLWKVVQDIASDEFLKDAKQGFEKAPMAVRISPYLLSLIDWNDPMNDPIRKQFLPLLSQLEIDHPMLTLDSLHEQSDSPVPGLTHRYPDKALFLVLDTCPVYCRFCTRSYAVGTDTENVEKVSIKATEKRWDLAIQYLKERPDIEDVVISGGDTYRLKAKQIRKIGHALLDIPHIRRMRFATKGLAIQPMKVLSDTDWTDAICEVVDRGRELHKEVVIHTHFNHPNEITGITTDALNLLFERGVTVRNQTVLQKGVNDTPEIQLELTRALGYMNIQPYYVYVHDLVQGTEDLRTTVQTALALEKYVRGSTAGFNTPTFVVDAPGGGGKRSAHSYEYYNRVTGVSTYTAPSVKPGEIFFYFDPLRSLSKEIQEAWQDPIKQKEMIEEARAETKKRLKHQR